MISLQQLHTFGLPAFAQSIDVINTESELSTLFDVEVFPLILGEGSNIIFVDDFNGKVCKINLKGIQINEQEESYRVCAKAGENWHQLVCHLVQKGINGLENLALIPGSVGAAPVQNIGAYGAEFADYCESVNCFDSISKEYLTLTKSECRFGYRDSIFKREEAKHLIITGVNLLLPKLWHPNLSYRGLDELTNEASAQDVLEKVMAIRRQKLPDPEVLGNAGSFFKNPVITKMQYNQLSLTWENVPHFAVDDENVKVPAAWLIEQCGFKGKSWGDVGCYTKQPLVLINSGQGTGKQLLQAAREIRDTVKEKFDIELVNEVRLIGSKGIVQL